MVPLVLYFIIMWNIAFWWLYRLNSRHGSGDRFTYEMAVVQAFTSGSNNFVSTVGFFIIMAAL
jgi:arsenite transporter